MTANSVMSDGISQKEIHVDRVDYLDGWRGLAIILVLISHFFPIKYFDLGRLGVDVFFVLSGMLMSNLLFIKKVPLKIFYKRRISRIFPVFFIFITVISMYSYIFNVSDEHNNYIFNLLFLRSYFPENPSIWNTGLPIGHLWSLNVEEHCYVILSIIAVISIFLRTPYIPVIMLGGASIVVYYLYIKFPDLAPASFSLRTEVAASFIMLSAGYYLIKTKFEHFVPSWLPVITFLLAVIFYSDYSPHWAAKWALSPFLLAFSVNHLNLTPLMIRNFLSSLPIRLLGLWSFSIYLWQQPFYHFAKNQINNEFIGFYMCFLAVSFGVFSFYFIENPTRKYLNKNW